RSTLCPRPRLTRRSGLQRTSLETPSALLWRTRIDLQTSLREQQGEFGTQLPVRRGVWPDHVIIAADIRTHVLVTDLEHSTNAATDRYRPLLIRCCQPVRSDYR